MYIVNANGVNFSPPLQINLASYDGWLWGENSNPHFRHIDIGSGLHTLVMIQFSRDYDMVVNICSPEKDRILKNMEASKWVEFLAQNQVIENKTMKMI